MVFGSLSKLPLSSTQKCSLGEDLSICLQNGDKGVQPGCCHNGVVAAGNFQNFLVAPPAAGHIIGCGFLLFKVNAITLQSQEYFDW